MGEYIYLSIGKIQFDWGKNDSYDDHSILFQTKDIKKIPYYYAEGQVIYQIGYSSKLEAVRSRLNILGFTLENIATRYRNIEKKERRKGTTTLPYGEFNKLITSIRLSRTRKAKKTETIDIYEYISKKALRILGLKKRYDVYKDRISELQDFFWEVGPYTIIRVLAENPINHNQEIQWGFADIVDAGYVKKSDIVHSIEQKDKILIVTEGSTDTYIIKKSIESLYPAIADFFYFIDMDKNYPFGGDGNLLNFYKGLVKMKVENKVIVLFDNDNAGVSMHDLALAMDRPKNICVCKLPNSDDFNDFSTIGPTGQAKLDINGKAVAIECFLDFNSIEQPSIVRWTSYDNSKASYQGELQTKGALFKAFTRCNLISGGYDTTKLHRLVDHLIREWTKQRKLR